MNSKPFYGAASQMFLQTSLCPLGGSEGRRDATSRGGVFAVREACHYLNLKPKTFAVQGFCNAGQRAALLHEELLGSKLIAANDSRGGVYDHQGIDAKLWLCTN